MLNTIEQVEYLYNLRESQEIAVGTSPFPTADGKLAVHSYMIIDFSSFPMSVLNKDKFEYIYSSQKHKFDMWQQRAIFPIESRLIAASAVMTAFVHMLLEFDSFKAKEESYHEKYTMMFDEKKS